jgi:predicted secreted protein
MAKQTGIPVTITVEDSGGTARDISSDVRSFTVNPTAELIEITGLDKTGMERLTGLLDVECTLNGVVNFAANKSHDVLKNFHVVNSGDAGREIVVDYGDATATFVVRFSAYTITRGDDGSLTWTATGSLSSGDANIWS